MIRRTIDGAVQRAALYGTGALRRAGRPSRRAETAGKNDSKYETGFGLVDISAWSYPARLTTHAATDLALEIARRYQSASWLMALTRGASAR